MPCTHSNRTQAALEIRQLKETLAASEARVSKAPAAACFDFASPASTLARNPKVCFPLLQPLHALRRTQVRDLVAQANQLSAAAEDLSDENAALRYKAGLPPGAAVDAGGVRVARDVALAQLRGVNAMLERQVRAGVWVGGNALTVPFDNCPTR